MEYSALVCTADIGAGHEAHTPHTGYNGLLGPPAPPHGCALGGSSVVYAEGVPALHACIEDGLALVDRPQLHRVESHLFVPATGALLIDGGQLLPLFRCTGSSPKTGVGIVACTDFIF